MTVQREIVIVGAGFAGSILARLLALRGREVLLIERDRQPRFALGESSTPLAALSLERLAERYNLPDLRSLAAHGRWLRDLPQLRRGLKRGFTFWAHRPGVAFVPSAENQLLVAASPSAEVADCHWLRADVDAYLVEKAQEAGVEYWDETEVLDVRPSKGAPSLSVRRQGSVIDLVPGFVVDGSGEGAVLARCLPIARRREPISFSSRLLYAHFEGVALFAEATETGEAAWEAPYPADWAAVHHLLDEGWMYALRFDDGLVSAGIVLDAGRAANAGQAELDGDASDLWQDVLARYPSLEAAFSAAQPSGFGIRATGLLQRRLTRAAATGWALLPHSFAFWEPLFSTGIAWSLVAVERLAELLSQGTPSDADLQRYESLIQSEADHLESLFGAASRARCRFPLFRSLTFLYFAAASFSEIKQRLLRNRVEGDSWAWEGFLGAEDREIATFFRQAPSRVESALRACSEAGEKKFHDWTSHVIRGRNLIGIGECSDHLYDVELDLIVERSELLGLTRGEVESRLPRLRGSV